MKQKAITVLSSEGGATCLSILIGRTALGWRICLNSFNNTLNSTKMRIHFMPPEVLPAQAPTTMTSNNMPHSAEGQSM